jgi:hypothetical protein
MYSSHALETEAPMKLLQPALTAVLLLTSLGVASKDYVPTDAERARWTMSDMRSLATAIEAYAIDHKAYPSAATMDAMIPLIQPIYMRKAHATDAWGRAYVYVPGADGTSYRLVSAGADGKTDPGSWGTAGPLSNFNDDAVFDSGSFTRPWPFL